MLKKIFTVLIIGFIILIPFCSFADVTEDMMNNNSQKIDRTKKEGDKVVERAAGNLNLKVDPNSQLINMDNSGSNTSIDPNKAIQNFGKGTYSLSWWLLVQIQKNSFPLCLIGIIISALITNVLGPRNMVKKKLGITMMFGFLSFWVIAQVAPVIFYLLIQ